jgi:hypothetical protein
LARRRRARRIAAGYFLVATLMLVWPVYPALGNHIEPRVLGLPWSFAYVLSMVLINFGVLVLLYRARIIEEEPGPMGQADDG